MSISNVVVKQKYTGDTVTVAFPIPFAFIPGELSVIKVAMYDSVTKDPITPVPSYTLTPAGDTPTAVTFALAPAATETIMVYRELPLTQVVDYIQNGSFLAESHEQGLDRIVLMIQQLADKGARSLQINMLDEGIVDVEIPPAIPDGVIGFNATGDALKVWSNGEFIGPAGEINSVSVAGELEYADPTPMSVTNIGTATNAQLEFVLRKGKTAEVAVGTVTTVAPTDPATVTNVGTSTNAILNFEIPKGDDGASTSLITTSTNLPNNSIGGDGDVWFVFDPLKPENGNVYQKAAGTYGLVGNIIGPPGGVNSFNSRTGAVVPAASDYDASMVDYDNTTSGLTATDLQDAVDELALNAVTTLNQAYLNSTTPQIGLNSTQGALTIADAATTVGTLLSVVDNAGTSSHFKVTSGGTAVGATTLNASAAFQVDSTTKGLLPPRMTTAQRDAISTPATGLQIFNTTTNKPNVYDGAKWSEVGSGAGTINFVTNPDGSNGTTGWTEGEYTAAARPSGTFTANSGSGKFSVSTTTTNPLGIGTTSLVFTKASGNQQGRAVETIFALPLDYRAKVLKLSASCINTSTNATDFAAGSKTTDSDMIFYTAYSTDGGTTYTVAEPSSFKLLSNSKDNSSPYDGTYQTPYNATHLKLIAYVATTSTTAWSIKAVLGVSPSQYVYGTPITDWQSYTPNVGNLVLNPTGKIGPVGYWRRVGDSVEVKVSFKNGSGGTATGTSYVGVSLPAGLIADTNKDGPLLGGHRVSGYGSLFTTISKVYFSGDALYLWKEGVDYYSVSDITANATFSIYASVPILGWSSSVQMSDGYDGRVVAANVYRAAAGAQSIPNNTYTAIGFDVNNGDETASWVLSRAAGSSYYLVPSAGWYRVSAVAGTASTVGSTLGIAVNSASGVDYKLGTSTSTALVSGSRDIKLKAGDKVYITIHQNSGSAQNLNEYWAEASISKLSGSPTISASAIISTQVASTNGQSFAYNTLTKIQFPTVISDSTGSWSIIDNEYNVPEAGDYEFDLTTSFQGISTSQIPSSVRFYVNDVFAFEIEDVDAAFASKAVSLGDRKTCLRNFKRTLKAGDKVSFYAFCYGINSTGNITVNTSTLGHRLNIKKVK